MKAILKGIAWGLIGLIIIIILAVGFAEQDDYNYSSSYSSGNYSSGYTYDRSDKYYRNNDYNNDGRISDYEFQGALSDYMYDLGY